VPYRLLKAFRKIHPRLVRELEKKFSGKDVVFVATRRILPPPKNGKSNSRPRSRTLTAVRGMDSGCVARGSVFKERVWQLLHGTWQHARVHVLQVHDAILDDLVFPTEIVGKRIRYKVDGSKVLKVRTQTSPRAAADRRSVVG
jgi:small subunit ribosomal protein S7e